MRHSGEYQNLVKTIVYWMLVFSSMTLKRFIQVSLTISRNWFPSRASDRGNSNIINLAVIDGYMSLMPNY